MQQRCMPCWWHTLVALLEEKVIELEQQVATLKAIKEDEELTIERTLTELSSSSQWRCWREESNLEGRGILCSDTSFPYSHTLL